MDSLLGMRAIWIEALLRQALVVLAATTMGWFGAALKIEKSLQIKVQ